MLCQTRCWGAVAYEKGRRINIGPFTKFGTSVLYVGTEDSTFPLPTCNTEEQDGSTLAFDGKYPTCDSETKIVKNAIGDCPLLLRVRASLSSINLFSLRPKEVRMSCSARKDGKTCGCNMVGGGMSPRIELPPMFEILVDRCVANDDYAKARGFQEVVDKISTAVKEREDQEGIVVHLAKGSGPEPGEPSPTGADVTAVAKVLSDDVEYLGNVTLPNEYRVIHKRYCQLKAETRHCSADVYARFTHPSIAEVLGDLRECVKVAAVTAVLTAVVFESPGAGLAIFKPAWVTCMYSKGVKWANEVSIDLWAEKECTPWG